MTYKCTVNPDKPYIPDNPNNEFNVSCLPGAVWETVEEARWPTCEDPTTTTAAPTTTQPPRSNDFKCAVCCDSVDPLFFRKRLLLSWRHRC